MNLPTLRAVCVYAIRLNLGSDATTTFASCYTRSVTDKLPPSKFGAGYTYGGPPAASSPPQPRQSAPGYPASPPVNSPAPSPTPAYGYPALDRQTPTAYNSISSAFTVPSTQPPPSPATAMIAAVLALVSSGILGWMASYPIRALVRAGSFLDGGAAAVLTVCAILLSIGTLLSIVGAVMLFNRSGAGSVCITLSFLCVVANEIVLLVYILVGLSDYPLDTGSKVGMLFRSLLGDGAVAVGTVLSIIVPLVAMMLALLSSTRRWCEAGPRSTATSVASRY